MNEFVALLAVYLNWLVNGVVGWLSTRFGSLLTGILKTSCEPDKSNMIVCGLSNPGKYGCLREAERSLSIILTH